VDESTKRCCTCHRDLPRTKFNRRAAAGDGLQARCRDCSRQWYEANRREHMANVRRRNQHARRDVQVLLAEYFAEHPCVDCGETDLRCLDFDHRDAATKEGNVGKMLGDALSWAKVLTEIEKCDVRCANCHRRVTSERGAWWRQVVYEQVHAERVAASHARLERVFGISLA
jgi:hypothetical protein